MYYLPSYILQKKLDFNLKLGITDTEFVVLTLGLYVHLAQKWREIKYFWRQLKSLFFLLLPIIHLLGPRGALPPELPGSVRVEHPSPLGLEKIIEDISGMDASITCEMATRI